jgi:large subunit ribosomal protein L30
MSDVRVSQVRSANGASPSQRATLRSLGLGRIGRSSSHPDSPAFRGMVRAVEHLIRVEESG